jgi:hypothetical protein
LASRGFYNPWNRASVYKLRQLPLTQYQDMLSLLDRVHDYFVTTLEGASPVKLILPPTADLRAIKIGKIVSSPTALKELFDRCIEIERGVALDLSSLPRIYQRFAV